MMLSIAWQFLKFLWYRNSVHASCVCIDMAWAMNNRDLRDTAEYFKGVLENRRS